MKTFRKNPHAKTRRRRAETGKNRESRIFYRKERLEHKDLNFDRINRIEQDKGNETPINQGQPRNTQKNRFKELDILLRDAKNKLKNSQFAHLCTPFRVFRIFRGLNSASSLFFRFFCSLRSQWLNNSGSPFSLRASALPRELCRQSGFSLVEVMIAIGVFFIASFAILGLVANTISNVRRLQRPPVDAGVLAAELSVTNKLTEGHTSGNLGEKLGKEYSEYTWDCDVEVAPPIRDAMQALGTTQPTPQSTKLYEIDFAIETIRTREIVSKVSFFQYSPLSDANSLDGGMHHP